MTDKPQVAIVGAGIGGLVTALACVVRGFDVTVYEQTDELQEVGAGLQVSANGTRVFAALGLLDAVRAVACEPVGKEIRLWSTGETWKLFDLGAVSVARYGFPYLFVHRADLQRVLATALQEARPQALRLGACCTGFADRGDAVELRFANGATARAGVLIGADGIHSRLRQALFGDDRPEFTGLMAWRGLVPAVRLRRGIRLVGTNWVGPGGHVVHYPLRRGELMNFVGIVERSDWRAESWTDRGTVAECAADFQGWHDDVHELIRNVEVPYKWALLGREPLPRWSAGRVTLLGDACHPTLPMLAQGANMAIEDGYVLARCLAAYDDPAAAVAAYEDARRDRTARIVRGSADNARRFHNATLATPGEAQRYIDTEWSEDRIEARYGWLFEYDATTAPIPATARGEG